MLLGSSHASSLVPIEKNSELSNIYVAHVDEDRLSEVIPEVEPDEDVDYVDGPAPRKLQ